MGGDVFWYNISIILCSLTFNIAATFFIYVHTIPLRDFFLFYISFRKRYSILNNGFYGRIANARTYFNNIV